MSLSIDILEQVPFGPELTVQAKLKLTLAKALFCYENHYLKSNDAITRYKSKRDITFFSNRNINRVGNSLIKDFLRYYIQNNTYEHLTLSIHGDFLKGRIKVSEVTGYTPHVSYIYNLRVQNAEAVTNHFSSNTEIFNTYGCVITRDYFSPFYSNYTELTVSFRWKVKELTNGLFFEEVTERLNESLSSLNTLASTLQLG